jgi:hypothetical protein
MSSISTRPFDINGVISTSNNVMNNLDLLCKACGAWMTYDIAEGKWCVIIKQEGSPVAHFDDTNIIGNINVSSTGITDLYNKVTITYPHKDLNDKTDQIDLEISADKRYADEIDNTLQIQTDLLNDPIQAQFIATVELKQNRLDTAIEFTTDFTSLGLKAGDIITVTNSIYGYSSKPFRIVKVEEEDAEVITVSITALEYDADVYNTSGLTRTPRDIKTGIIPKSANSVIKTIDDAAITAVAGGGLSPEDAATIAAEQAALALANQSKSDAIGKIVYDGSAPGVSVLCKWFVVDALAVPQGSNPATNITTFPTSFTNPFEGNGQFLVNYEVNWGSNTTIGPISGCRKGSRARIKVNGSYVTLGLWAQTGDLYEPLYTDHMVSGYFTAQKDDVITFAGGFGTNFGEQFREWVIEPSTGVLTEYFWDPGTYAAVWLVVTLTYLGPVTV